MPELPEVESVRNGLAELLPKNPEVKSVTLHRADLRVPITPGLSTVLPGQRLIGVRRRAKYLLLDFSEHTMISHLGMSGSWRLDSKCSRRKHDHVEIDFADGCRIVFHDPRRFGILELVRRHGEGESKWLKNLGVEPLQSKFTASYMREKAKDRSISVKALLMDQRIVVGVGNIYASEALFSAGVRPSRRAAKVTSAEWGDIVRAVRGVLKQSIRNGGTTLRDYARVDGRSGKNQNRLRVYDRHGESCPRCETMIKSAIIAGRSTYWCPQCQR